MSQSRRLYLLRHAKSSWNNHEQADHDRPLSERGQRALKLLAEYVETKQIRPDLVLCSSARRTRETMEGVSPDSTVLIEHRLYGATCDDLIERLHQVPPDLQSVMLIGHNPALQMLVMRLARGEVSGRPARSEGLEEIRNKLPTAALVTLELEDQWAELDVGSALLADYARPKALSQLD